MPTLPSGYQFPNYLTPNSNINSYEGTIHDMYIKGGFQSVNSISERNLIPIKPDDSAVIYNGFSNSGDGGWTTGRRKVGMLVHVLEDQKFYILLPVGYFGNGGSGDETAWLALSEAERALRLYPTGTFTIEAANPGNSFTTQTISAADLGISADANSCWVELELRRKGDPIDDHIIPDTNEAYDLGSPEKKFRDLYLSSNTLYIGGQPLSVSNGQLVLNGNPVTGSLDVYKATQPQPVSTVASQLAFSVPGSTTGAYLSPTQNRALVEDGTSIKVYRLQGGTWSQEGSDIPFFGTDFLRNYGNGQRRWSKDGSSFQVWNWTDATIMKVYFWDGSDWQQRGADLTYTRLRACDINEDGTKVTAIDNSVRTHTWDGTSWQEATQITASSCNMSADGLRLATYVYGSGVYVWDWNGTQWTNQTLVSNVASSNGEFSGNGNAIYIYESGNGPMVYFWNGTTWQSSLIVPEPNLTYQSYGLSHDGTKLLFNHIVPNNIHGASSNYKWSIWEYNGSTWSKSTLTRFDATRNASTNYDLDLVLGNKHIGSPQDFYTYDIPDPINESLDKYLETIGYMEGDTLDIWFDNSLAYMPLETCYIYTDELNWIGCRVIQNTTATNNILRVKILEKLGDISTYEYSITNSPLHLSNYTKETVSINQSASSIDHDFADNINMSSSSIYFPNTFLPVIIDSYTEYAYDNVFANAMSYIHYRVNGDHLSNVKILDPFSKYKYRVGSLRGIFGHEYNNGIIQPEPNPIQNIFSFYTIAIVNTDPSWPNGLNDLPTMYETWNNRIYSQGIKYLILDRITVDIMDDNITSGNSYKIFSDESSLPYEIELNQVLAILLLRSDDNINFFSSAYVNLNYDLIKYDSQVIDAPPITPTATPWPTATPTPTPTPTATATPVPPTPTPTSVDTIDINVVHDPNANVGSLNVSDAFIVNWSLSNPSNCSHVTVQGSTLSSNGPWSDMNTYYDCQVTSMSYIWGGSCGTTRYFRIVQTRLDSSEVISNVYTYAFPSCPTPTPTPTSCQDNMRLYSVSHNGPLNDTSGTFAYYKDCNIFVQRSLQPGEQFNICADSSQYLNVNHPNMTYTEVGPCPTPTPTPTGDPTQTG